MSLIRAYTRCRPRARGPQILDVAQREHQNRGAGGVGRYLFDLATLDQIAADGCFAVYTVFQILSGTNYASSTRNGEANLSEENAVFPVVLVLAEIHGIDGSP